MPETDLIPIGAFARRSGLTASALRFYGDSGVLRPADVDATSGYRYYHVDQLERALTLRRLRELDMPLVTVEQVLTADPAHAVRLIDEHVATLSARADAARRLAVEVKTALTGEDAVPLATMKGPVFAAAVDQVLVATGVSDDFPAIAGVRLEMSGEALTLTATDRFRLSTRTLVPDELSGTAWSATLSGDDLRAVLGDIRGRHVVRIEALPDGVRFRTATGAGTGGAGGSGGVPGHVPGAVRCRLLDGEFPDHHALRANLSDPVARVVVAKDGLLRAIESCDEPTIRLRTRAGECVVVESGEPGGVDPGGTVHPQGAVSEGAARGARVRGEVECGEVERVVEATVDGADTETWFGVPVLHPAVVTAVGPDVMLDVRGPSEPILVRSADNGDLATLVMPVGPPAGA
ncbi:MerR family transcriptional regulator [Prauserella halophila]|uniref:MerR family transcriptional regulator n=1 Tax=Prauserella halophila TaxID=185641 RepID=A0ABN1W629_9PSEU|nr:MerR family transcriptional regulator [Prauserella halophila]MCP2235562.1 DNA-binding transcriptional regulator, MerR family [Prauserella halophila]